MTDVRDLERRCLALLRSWCDSLVGLQVRAAGPRFDGGIACPACLHLHGRAIDAVWPLALLADRTGEERYLDAAVALVDWGENLVCDDGSYYNDAQQAWNKTTIFFASSLAQALEYHGDILPAAVRDRWEGVLERSCDWIMARFGPEDPANVNYHAGAAGALAAAGAHRRDARLLVRARELAEFALGFVGEDGLPFGEGRPRDLVTPGGCVSVDVGYALEETLPGLVDYALHARDEGLLSTRLLDVARACAPLVLPDGGVDNSFGTRNFKWTWWGSRTSDGMARAFAVLARYDASLLDVVGRNLSALEACTHDGMLYGGPDYRSHGEQPCVHHQFAHAKSLAGCLEPGALDELADLSGDAPCATSPDLGASGVRVRRYPSAGSVRLESGRTIATVTATEYRHFEGGHASGGSMGLLWHAAYGAALASGPTDDLDREPLNTQLSLTKADHASSAWRLWYQDGGRTLANVYDLGARLELEDGAAVVSFGFCERSGARDPRSSGRLRYELRGDEVLWTGALDCPVPVRLTLPVVARSARRLSGRAVALVGRSGGALTIEASETVVGVRPTFSLAPGFACACLEIDLAPRGPFSLAWRFCP